jgi:RNA polymerase sigma factor (sigma-70 family)
MATQENLARRAQKGDKDALGELITNYRSRLAALVNSRLNAHAVRTVETEDIVQETHLRACQAISRFTWQGGDSFLRWLGGIAEHVIVDVIRKSVKTRTSGLDTDLAASAQTASRLLRRGERFDRLRQAIDMLDADQRRVVLLARLKKLPIKVIAEEMGRSPDAISQLLIRAVRKLKELMGDTESLNLPHESIEFGDGD